MRMHLHCVQRCGPIAVHPRAGHKHPGLWQVRSPCGVQKVRLCSNVEQDKEVHTAPRAQKGQERRGQRRGHGGVRRRVWGGVEGKESEAPIHESFFYGFGVAEDVKQSDVSPLCLVHVLKCVGIKRKHEKINVQLYEKLDSKKNSWDSDLPCMCMT